MILYQLAKWMEKRDRLNEHMLEPHTDSVQLVVQRRRLEEEILGYANDWKIETASEWFQHE